MGNEKLKNCPFCDGEVEMEFGGSGVTIICKKCKVEFYFPEEWTLDNINAHWNTRQEDIQRQRDNINSLTGQDFGRIT